MALFRACAREAAVLGCARMEWQVLNWNTPSIEFYQRLGARQLDAWLTSERRRELLQEAEPFSEAMHTRKVRWGFDPWFASKDHPDAAPPPACENRSVPFYSSCVSVALPYRGRRNGRRVLTPCCSI